MDLAQVRETFLRRLSASHDLDDPLAIHQQYIESLKAIIPSSEPQTKLLLEALERTTQAFIDDRRYSNDPRYLRVWLDYAARCREPEDVFAFLSMKAVCLDLAAYYEEYAGYLERRKIEVPGAIEKIVQIYQAGIERRAQPIERLTKYYNEFLQRKCPERAASSLASQKFDEATKRQSWSQPQSSGISCWTAASQKKRSIEVHGYNADLLEGGIYCFEEVRAQHYKSRPPIEAQIVSPKLAVIDVNAMDDDDDELDDVPSLAHAVNPEDLTHISVYRDNTADLKELAKMAVAQNEQNRQMQCDQNEKENQVEPALASLVQPMPLHKPDVVMTFVGDEDDPFERIQEMEASDAFGAFPFDRNRKKDSRLSLIPEEPETTSHSILSHLNKRPPIAKPTSTVTMPILTSESRQLMESLINPGLIHNLLVVHESALAKVRQLEKCIGRDGIGGNQTVSALKIANGHFFIERRISPPAKKIFLAVDLEADVSSGKCNQWALKIISPPSKWESFVISRLATLQSHFLPEVKSCCHYNDAMFMTFTFYDQGSIQDALALCNQVDELLVLFYTSQLLKILSALISAGIIHTRITLDRLMIRSNDYAGQWTSQYRPDGSQGWSSRGLSLIGFGKAVDLGLLAKVTSHSEGFSLDGIASGHEHDMRDIAKVIARLLTNSPAMPPSITASHQFASLWNKIFTFLNSTFVPSITSATLGELVSEVDNTLELASVQCTPSLKSLLTKLEICLLNSK